VSPTALIDFDSPCVCVRTSWSVCAELAPANVFSCFMHSTWCFKEKGSGNMHNDIIVGWLLT
jgi:hypothetical protein